jgi:site-specific recombinase XerD
MVDLRRKHYVGPKFKNFTDRTTALDYASEIGEKAAKSGLTSISVHTSDPKLVAFTEQAALYNKTLDEVFALGLAECERDRKVKDSPFMAELLTSWMDEKTLSKLTPLRERSKKSIRNMAETFQKDFGTARIKEVTKARVEQYLNDKDVSNQTRKNLRSYLGQFFNWCKAKSYHDQNPAESIKIHVESGVPEFFSVEQCDTIMAEAKKDPNMTAYFALCLFGGIRPEEAERMTWKQNIKLATKEIYIQAAISKTKKDRLFVMSDNLFAWLQHCQDVKPLVPQVNIKNLRVRISKRLGFDWIQDGLRHTFATFHYSKHHDLEELRHIMGNSPGVIERFYKGVISASEIEKFWNILPSSEPPKNTETEPKPAIDLNGNKLRFIQ